MFSYLFWYIYIFAYDSAVLVFTGVFMLLRTYAGGLHLNSYFGCFICSTIIQTTILLIDNQYTIILPIAWGIILSSAALILINAPVENINRVLDEDEKRHCKKLTSRILLGIIIFRVIVQLLV